MRIKIILLAVVTISLLSSCNEDENIVNNPPFSSYEVGKNHFIVNVDGDEREYYVHVPAGYIDTTSTPVVFMLHGTSGDGEKFYNISGWKEVGETENIITVFPSSWRYCIITGGQQKNTTKWNAQPAGWSFCTEETPRDDIKFLNTIIADLNSKFNVDTERIYLAGFSNGGQMAGKCTIEMSDKFAAIVESAGSLFSDTTSIPTYFPLRKMPITYQTGNEDYGSSNTGPAVPMNMIDTLLTTPNLPLLNGKPYRIAHTHINSFALNPNFTITGDINSVAVATYTSLTPDPMNVFQFVLIKDLAHAYPNGNNHPFEAAKANWQWMKKFRLP
jgi:polyhydroxybutyrate depolymerase